MRTQHAHTTHTRAHTHTHTHTHTVHTHTRTQHIPHTRPQVMAVTLLMGTMASCTEPDSGAYVDPYYVVPAGQNINKTW